MESSSSDQRPTRSSSQSNASKGTLDSLSLSIELAQKPPSWYCPCYCKVGQPCPLFISIVICQRKSPHLSGRKQTKGDFACRLADTFPHSISFKLNLDSCTHQRAIRRSLQLQSCTLYFLYFLLATFEPPCANSYYLSTLLLGLPNHTSDLPQWFGSSLPTRYVDRAFTSCHMPALPRDSSTSVFMTRRSASELAIDINRTGLITEKDHA